MNTLVSCKAPDFTASAVAADGHIIDTFTLSREIRGKYALLFFYPLDFTFVCPSELIALDKRISEFQQRGTEVIAISIDSHFTHNAWRNTDVDKGGIGPVKYTLVADMNHQICREYGIEHPTANVALRASFIIDRDMLVRAQVVNDLPIGRNIDEMIRLIDAVQFHEENGEVCPAGWQKGKQGMQASISGVSEYLSKHTDEL